MRSRLIDLFGRAVDALRKPGQSSQRQPERQPQRPRRPSQPPSRPSDTLRIEYSPRLDGDPDPGEVVWIWVAYEDDPSQGKDRPVVVVGRRGKVLVGVALTSKRHPDQPQVAVGTGPWDRELRPSYAKVDRLLDIDPAAMRREGAVLDRTHFDAVVAALG